MTAQLQSKRLDLQQEDHGPTGRKIILPKITLAVKCQRKSPNVLRCFIVVPFLVLLLTLLLIITHTMGVTWGLTLGGGQGKAS